MKSASIKSCLRFLLVIAIFSVFNACAMRQVRMQAMKPALITVPGNIKTVVILDRSMPPNNTQAVFGAILSAELPGERAAAVQQAIAGIERQMRSTHRFEIVVAEESLRGNNISSAFPEPLAWNVIEDLCRKYNADAVVAMEIFSTKFVVTNGARAVKKVDPKTKKEISSTEFYAEGIASAQMGFRLYNAIDKNILDQRTFSTSNNWGASGRSVADAMGLMINKAEALRRVSFNAGLSYGQRISPSHITITRDFYNRPKRNIPISKGTRQADTNQWHEALETWTLGAEHAHKRKLGGRLAYNTAIAFEVLGDLDNAIEWAGIAWVDYGNKKGRDYARTLRRRQQQEQRLNEQFSDTAQAVE